MIESVEDRGFKEALELKGTRDEFCKKSRIKYTRAMLFELIEAEVCSKLPSDFDLLILRDHGLLLTSTRSLAFHGERWDNHLHTRSKESHLQIKSSLEGVCQLLPQKLEKNAVVVHRGIQKCDLFQLSKTKNPYQPPHLNKKIPPPSASFYEPEVQSLVESEQKGSADDITGQAKSGSCYTLAGANNVTKEPLGKYKAFKWNNEGNEVNEPADEFEEFWSTNERNEVISANKSCRRLAGDNQSTFDDFWADILEIIHVPQEPNTLPMNSHQFPDEPPSMILENTILQQEPDTSPLNSHSDSEAEIHFPDEESLTSVDPSLLPECLNILNLDEVNLPDENSLITIDDMIVPDLRHSTKSACAAKLDHRCKRPHHHKAQKSQDFSGFASHWQLYYHHLPHNLLCHQIGFLPLFLTPNCPYLPFCPEISLPNTEPNCSFPHYSLFHQPNIFPKLPNHPLLGTTVADPKNQMAVYDVEAMQFLKSTSKQAIHGSFGKS